MSRPLRTSRVRVNLAATAPAVASVSQPPVLAPGVLAALVGISGSGKSTLAGRYPATWVLNLDSYRGMATDDPADQTGSTTASLVQDLFLDARLARGLTTVVDSTNVFAHVRAGLLARARYWQRPAAAILLDVPLETCRTQMARRDRQVPDEVLQDQHAQLPDTEQLLAEGFGRVYLYRPVSAPVPGRAVPRSAAPGPRGSRPGPAAGSTPS